MDMKNYLRTQITLYEEDKKEEAILLMAEHSPSPTPERAIYGFVLYLVSFVGLAIYLVWAYTPDEWLLALGITYYPQKYWALAGPTFFCVAGAFILSLYFAYNITTTSPMDSISTITDEHAKPVQMKGLPAGAIPPIEDISISQVNRMLYSSSNYSSGTS